MRLSIVAFVALSSMTALADPYRFVAFNIWGNYFGNPPEERAPQQAAIVNEYSPDFVALQEMTADFWASALIGDLTNRYETVGRGMGPGGVDAYTPVLYRRDRFEPIAKGAKWFCPELDRSKGVVWVVVKDRASGANVLAFASHFWWRSDGEGDDFIRLDNARQLYAEVTAAAEKYGASVVGGGDLNAVGESRPMRELKKLGWLDAQETTPGRDSRLTWHGEPERNWRTGRYEGVTAEKTKKRACTIDHVFYAPEGVRAREFRVDTRQKALDVSDHSPLVFDFDVHEKRPFVAPRRTMSLAAVPQSVDTNHWWVKRFNQKKAEIGADRDVVFVGDSITHGWETTGKAQWEKYFANAPYNALNLGFSADRTEHVLWRIEQGELDGYTAKAVVLMIGTNNTGHFPVEKTPPLDVIVGVRAVVDAIRGRQPNARIILHPIFPRGEKPTDPNRVRNEIVNAEIAKLADGRNVIWCDFNDRLLEADGTLSRTMMPDLLHPGAAGYEIWANEILPIIDRILRTKPGEPVAGRYAKPAAEVSGLSRPCKPVSRFDISGTRGKWWWTNRLLEKRNEIAAADGAFDLVMVGDSITHFWEDFNYWSGGLASFDALRAKYRVLNLGYGGDHTENVLWRLGNGELDGYKAKCFMLMIGTNNNGDTPEDTSEGIRRILDLIAAKHPEATTLLLPVFPRGKPGDRQRVRLARINELIRGFVDGRKVRWLDFTDRFLQEDGTMKPNVFLSDNLHPAYAGYEIWRTAIEPTLEEIVK